MKIAWTSVAARPRRGGRRRIRALAGAVAALALVCAAAAANEELTLTIGQAPPGTSALGAGFRLSGSPYAATNGKLDVVPLYLYEGRRVFAHGTFAGAHLHQGAAITVDAIARYRFWELDPEDHPSHAGLERRRQTVEGGLALSSRRPWGELRVEWLWDLLDRHEGTALEASVRRRFEVGRWSVSPYFTLSRLDADLTLYYFGVTRDEQTAERPAYAPGRALNFGYGLNAAYRLTERAEVFVSFGAVELDARIVASPLVNGAVIPTMFIGGHYAFGNIYEPVLRIEQERLWSWRVNYGYQAEGNIVGEIDQGDFRRSVHADTRIAGLTISRLLNSGPQFDFYGRLAMLRHLERPAQGDFSSAAAYVMAVGKGYFPWSDQPSFRWGFGLGVSYAQRVPVVEQIKQTRRGRNTTRFLNYLEMTLDFPVGRLLSLRRLEACYAGLTVVHRSGIFASSDILGSVSGASDWISAHLECFR